VSEGYLRPHCSVVGRCVQICIGLAMLTLLMVSTNELQAQQESTTSEAVNQNALEQQSAGQLDNAIELFLQAARQSASEAGAKSRTQSYRLNAARTMIEAGQRPQAISLLADITNAFPTINGNTAPLKLAAADLYRRLVNELDASNSYRRSAYDLLAEVLVTAESTDKVTRAWATGYQAALFEDETRYEDALALNRTAINNAQQAPEGAALYRWEWQHGRLLAALGRGEDAIQAYARASDALDQQRATLQVQKNSYRDIFRPLYYEFANLLLEEVASAPDSSARQDLLLQVQQTLETVKTAEIEDYFQEKCVVADGADLTGIDRGTAVLYPIILDDRLNLVVSTAEELTHVTVPISRPEIIAAIRDFRINVQVDTATQDYLRLSQQLYNWLLAPLDNWITDQKIDTLVIIPDGPLRTIPFAALHDGDQFVVERLSIATAPGLNLVGLAKDSPARMVAFASGLSTAVQGFSALPSVEDELAAIEDLLPTKVLKNTGFTTAALTRELTTGGYSVVHLATHGQFRSSYEDSFLLTHDDRLQLNELGDALLARRERFGPLDLLVLSACETAAGDDRAALGVAGVAIKSGARSALASLWEVDDAATKELIATFYKNLTSNPTESKALHLRNAQTSLIAQPDFQHPSNWAPFLIIGDWL